MSFGSVVSLCVLIVAALVLNPKGIQVDSYEQAALMLTQPLGYWGFVLFAASLGIACFGAALEISLDTAYIVSQAFGWNWGENLHPTEAARFSLVYTVFVFLASPSSRIASWMTTAPGRVRRLTSFCSVSVSPSSRARDSDSSPSPSFSLLRLIILAPLKCYGVIKDEFARLLGNQHGESLDKLA